MTKKLLLTGLTALLLSITSLGAYDLKSNMLQLNSELSKVQKAFLISDQEGVKESITEFAKHAQDLLGNKEKFQTMLPKDKQHKVNSAVIAAQIIEHNVQIILDAINNKYQESGRIRREKSQVAYTYIEDACFRCHNVVRDNY